MPHDLLISKTIYYEAATLNYLRGQEIFARHPDAGRIEVASHWNIPELHRNEALVSVTHSRQAVASKATRGGCEQAEPLYQRARIIERREVRDHRSNILSRVSLSGKNPVTVRETE
jgi:hypothetical protein